MWLKISLCTILWYVLCSAIICRKPQHWQNHSRPKILHFFLSVIRKWNMTSLMVVFHLFMYNSRLLLLGRSTMLMPLPSSWCKHYITKNQTRKKHNTYIRYSQTSWEMQSIIMTMWTDPRNQWGYQFFRFKFLDETEVALIKSCGRHYF